MPLHHILSAAFLGEFSFEKHYPRRNRKLFVGDLKEKKIFVTTASKIGAEKNFYSIREFGKNPNVLDDIWSEYEMKLNRTLYNLVRGGIDAEDYLRTLVPFVTSLLIRGKDFNYRFPERFSEKIKKSPNLMNPNNARFLELQRLLSSVTAAKYLIMRKSGDTTPLITNDIGYSPFQSVYGDIGIAIPINSKFVLSIIPNRNRKLFFEIGKKWWSYTSKVILNKNNHLLLNKITAKTANRFIYGSDKETIEGLINLSSGNNKYKDMGSLGFLTGTDAIIHEFAWHKITSIVCNPNNLNIKWDNSFDFQRLSEGWCPPIVFPDNIPEFPPSFYRKGGEININLYNIPGEKFDEIVGAYMQKVLKMDDGMDAEFIRKSIEKGAPLYRTGN